MNGILLEFAGRMADSGAAQLPESYKQLVVNAQFFFKGRMSGGLGRRLGDNRLSPKPEKGADLLDL